MSIGNWQNIYSKIKKFFSLIASTPYWGWIIFFQLVSGIASVIGLPILIPVLQLMQGDTSTLGGGKYFAKVRQVFDFCGIELNFQTLLLCAVGLIILAQILVVYSSILATFAKENLLEKYRKRILNLYSQVDWRWLTENHSGGLYYAMIQESKAASDANWFAMRVLINAVQIFVLSFIIIQISWKIAVMAAGVFIFLGIINMFNVKAVYRLAREYNVLTKKLTNQVVGFNENKKFLKVSLLTNQVTRQLDTLIVDSNKLVKRQTLHSDCQQGWTVTAAFIFLAVLLLFHKSFALDYAMLMVVLLVFSRIVPQFVTLFVMGSSLGRNLPMSEALENHFQQLEMNKEKNGTMICSGGEEIRFDRVGFYYTPGVPVLQNLSFTINPYQTVAFVGGSGAGKTTILDLILGLMAPTSGEIYYGAVPQASLDKTSLRKVVAYVAQNLTLFDGTIRENLIIGNPKATDEEIREICRMVYLSDFIDGLPEGLDTMIGENGVKLSGGQKQRIVLGRCLFLRPKILILDEATSDLDLESEVMIKRSLESLKSQMTIIMVAHRLSTVQSADVIYVIENGSLYETGTYADLLAKKGRLHFLDSLQKGNSTI